MASANVHEFTDRNFEDEVLQSSKPVLVQFFATWCGLCKQLSPIVDKIADDFSDKIKVGRLDIDQSPDVTSKYGVRSVPTCIVFQDGHKEGTHTGLTKRDTLVRLLDL